MYKLMIADDEDDERIGIKYLLKKCGFCFDIMEAADGRDALEKLGERGADILFTDVKMPFLNGLELSAKAKLLIPDIQIIFFSGFDDFEYVKQALSLQAVDYILKPVNPAEFQKTIQMVIERMEERTAVRQQSQQSRKAYILTRLFNKMPFDKLKEKYKEEELAFLKEYGQLILLEFDEEFFGNNVADVYELRDRINNMQRLTFDLIDLNPSQGVMLIKEKKCLEQEYRQMAQCIHLLIEKEYRAQCYLSISPILQDPQDIATAYAEMERYLEERFFNKGVYVYPVDREKLPSEIGTGKEGQILSEIEQDVKRRDAYSLRKNVEQLIEKCRNNSFQSYIYTRFVCANLLKILSQGLEDEQLIANVEQLYVCNQFQDIELIIGQVMKRLEKKLTDNDSPSHVISIVEQFIRQHYMEELSLDILADKVYLTPHYLSSIFSREKGIGINRYIKNIRMENAKGLLLDTNMKINDICKAVGYSNLSYFCKAFRNEYGVTPEKYREYRSCSNMDIEES